MGKLTGAIWNSTPGEPTDDGLRREVTEVLQIFAETLQTVMTLSESVQGEVPDPVEMIMQLIAANQKALLTELEGRFHKERRLLEYPWGDGSGKDVIEAIPRDQVRQIISDMRQVIK